MVDYQMLKESLEMFQLDGDSWKAVADEFKREIDLAEAGGSSSLKILPAFLSPPSGNEKGNYTAIDFGGSNLRVMQVQLLGLGLYRIAKQISRPLQDPQVRYDFTGPHISGSEIFGWIADMVGEVLMGSSTDGLGFTFSFPMQQLSIDSARLLSWTKELKPSGTVGQDPSLMLGDALKSKGIKLKPSAIINDTVAVFLTGSYCDASVCAGSICGTGFNTCILEYKQWEHPMIVNTEAGNYSRLPLNIYDKVLDAESENPGQQIVEKMVSGKYLGELLRIALKDLGERGAWGDYDSSLPIWNQPFALKTEVMDWLQKNDPQAGLLTAGWMAEMGIPVRGENQQLFSILGKAIVQRAIMLISASYCSVLQRTPLRYGPRQLIAVDGALFKHWPGFLSEIEKILKRELPDRSVSLRYTQDGSSVGAAIAAALAG